MDYMEWIIWIILWNGLYGMDNMDYIVEWIIWKRLWNNDLEWKLWNYGSIDTKISFHQIYSKKIMVYDSKDLN
jgi:hypothetical protein